MVGMALLSAICALGLKISASSTEWGCAEPMLCERQLAHRSLPPSYPEKLVDLKPCASTRLHIELTVIAVWILPSQRVGISAHPQPRLNFSKRRFFFAAPSQTRCADWQRRLARNGYSLHSRFQGSPTTNAAPQSRELWGSSHPSIAVGTNQLAENFVRFQPEWGFRMNRPIISVIAAIALIAAATSMLRSHSVFIGGHIATAGVPSLQDMQSGSADKLAVEDFEDRSLVYPRETKR
jgi:hypothetical protein